MAITELAKPVLAAVATFLVTGFALGTNAAFTAFSSVDYAAPRTGGSSTLIGASWNKILDNVTNHEVRIGSTILWKDLATPIIREIQFAGSVTATNVSIPGIPSNARYVLADVYYTANSADHQNVAIGRNPTTQKNWVEPTRGAQPSTQFGNNARHSITLTYTGDNDGFSSNYGIWYPSQVIPLNVDGTFGWTNYSNSGSNGYLYLVIKAYSL